MKNCSSTNQIPKEMDKQLETYNLPRMNYEEIGNLNRPTMSKEIESVIINILTKKSPRPNGFTGEFCEMPKEKFT